MQRWMSTKEKEKPFLSHPNHLMGRPPRGYLDGTLHDERRELGHHQVHALKAGLFQFEDLLFDNGLKGQVRGEEPRPGDIRRSGVTSVYLLQRQRERDRGDRQK